MFKFKQKSPKYFLPCVFFDHSLLPKLCIILGEKHIL